VRHFGYSQGNIRHWQPLLSKYSTPQNTSYKSTVRGLVCLRTLSSKGLISSKASLLMSLGYLFLMPQFTTRHAIDCELPLTADCCNKPMLTPLHASQ